jgi:hypothetical protein
MPTRQSRPHASEHEELADLPGFRPSPPEEAELHPDETIPEATDQPATSSPPMDPEPPSLPPAAPAAASGRSSPVSISAELRDELENFSGGVFELAGLAANRVVQRRTHSNTRLWLVTEEEAEDFGAAAGRILARRVPEELAEGDGADALIMGSVILGYAMRNVTGNVTQPPGEELAPGVAYQPPPPAPQPPPRAAEQEAPSPPAAASPAAPVRAGSPVVVGVEAATPPPPFSPDL